MKKSNIAILLVVLLALSTGFYFRNNIINWYHNFGSDVLEFQKKDLSEAVNQLKKNILTPGPLRIGGKVNQVTFTGAKIIAQTNIARFNNGMLPPLFENEKLNNSALAKAQDMFAKQYFEHISPLGVGPGDLAKLAGYEYIFEGENLIMGNFKNEEEMISLWMQSPGHRANILHDRFVDIGVAIIKGTYNGETVWMGVQEFGLPISACPQTDANLKNTIDTNKINLDGISLELEVIKKEIDKTPQSSPKYNLLINEYNKLAGEYNTLNQEIKKIILEYNQQIDAFNQCVTGT